MLLILGELAQWQMDEWKRLPGSLIERGDEAVGGCVKLERVDDVDRRRLTLISPRILMLQIVLLNHHAG